MWDLVGNPEDRFSHDTAHIIALIRVALVETYLTLSLRLAVTAVNHCCL